MLDVTQDRSWPTHSATVWAALRTRVNRHLSADGLAHSDNLESLETAPDSIPWCIRQRSAVLNEPPKITVIVATRERPGALRVCLESLLRQEYPRFEVVVVDNDPDTIETTKLIATRFYPRVQYVREPRRGATWAYQRGLQAARGNIAAFVDDNVVVDKSWLTGIAEGFASAANVGCVAGLVLPATLRRQAQLAFEHDGFLEGGFTQRIFDNDRTQPGNRLFAFAAGRFGHAMNAGFDTALLRRLGGVDPTCGTERFTRGGRDLSAFFRVVLEHRVVYQPARNRVVVDAGVR